MDEQKKRVLDEAVEPPKKSSKWWGPDGQRIVRSGAILHHQPGPPPTAVPPSDSLPLPDSLPEEDLLSFMNELRGDCNSQQDLDQLSQDREYPFPDLADDTPLMSIVEQHALPGPTPVDVDDAAADDLDLDLTSAKGDVTLLTALRTSCLDRQIRVMMQRRS